jgi:hypothetical protein
MVDNSIVVCFESHFIAGLGLPPSKFLVAILNFLRYELVHLHLNAITTLRCFTMLCKCWLRIALDTNLFLYFKYLARYDKTIFSGISLSRSRHRQKEYLDATFKGCWKGASRKWFLVDMHVLPQWSNKHLLPPHIDDKQGEPEMTPLLATLVKWVIELCSTSLRACHCAEEFNLQRIFPLGHREKLAYERPQLVDSSRYPADSKILISFITATGLLF